MTDRASDTRECQLFDLISARNIPATPWLAVRSSLAQIGRMSAELPPPNTMPAVFVGHGNPMNAITTNDYTAAWSRLAAELPRPRAILAISAHWYQPGIHVTAQAAPPTIHDFGGFPRELFAVEYPAPGSTALAAQVGALLGPTPVQMSERWGIDHGTWSVLVHMYPKADIPVVQLSIDETLSAPEHLALARRLKSLRQDGVLIFGSGNVVHNLHAYGWGRKQLAPYDWGLRFEERVRASLQAGRFDEVAAYEQLGSDAALSAPTPEHFLPLLYVLGQHQLGDAVTFPCQGFDGGSVSMLSVKLAPG
jgi:4,5-DOPA dioxygenase extradiol